MNYRQLLFIDETWTNEQCYNRTYGRALKGKPCYAPVTFVRKFKINLILACNYNGPVFHDIFLHNNNIQNFMDFLFNLLPHLNEYPGENSIVLMDNAAWHHKELITIFCQLYGLYVIWLPAYFPLLCLAEYVFQGIKKKIKYRSSPTNIYDAILSVQECIEELAGLDYRGLLRKLGYLNTQTDD